MPALGGATRLGRDYAGAASEYAGSVPRAGTEILGTARSNLSDIFRAQPLALGAAIGVGRGRAGDRGRNRGSPPAN
jgi:hypothetical protein